MPQLLHTLLPTSLVGSYPQPDWLVDRDNLRGAFAARARKSCGASTRS
jgi:5-methyltetrahydropteroyltriglutamate--homocysteine methyltransferase